MKIRIFSSLILLALIPAAFARAQFSAETESNYVTKINAEVIKVIPLDEHAFIVFVNKGKDDGVKERTMALKYDIKTTDAEIGLIQNFAPLTFEDMNAGRFKRPFIAFLNCEPKYTAFLFWAYDEKIVAAKTLAQKAGKPFADAVPKPGDKVQFVASKKE